MACAGGRCGLATSIVLLLATTGLAKQQPQPEPNNGESDAKLWCAFRNATWDDGEVGRTRVATGCVACYAMVTENGNILRQGCWANPADCAKNNCTRRSLYYAATGDDVRFCCCGIHMCNSDMLVVGANGRVEATGKPADNFPTAAAHLLAAAVVSLFLVLAVMRRILASKAPSVPLQVIVEEKADSFPLLPAATTAATSTSTVDISALNIESAVGKGEFSTVYRATIATGADGENKRTVVAVKAFFPGPEAARRFAAERSVYEMRHLNNRDCLLEYFGSREVSDLGRVIVTSYAERGTLASYLEANIVSWPELCRMLSGISRGVAHLHAEEEVRAGPPKSVVCHRDINCRNILVTADLSCKISSLGRALVVPPGGKCKLFLPLPEEEFGTARYLAPEILDGSVATARGDRLSDVKQADVYATALVMWEASRRCADLYQGSRVPHFEVAFEAELGSSGPVSAERMRVLVSTKGARPLFPPVWKEANPAVQLLRETIEYSWDSDGDARLTAPCVAKRISELPALWDAYYAKKVEAANNAASAHSWHKRINYHANDVSETSIILVHSEPTLTLLWSPSPYAKDDNLRSGQRAPAGIQPHQAANPTKQRNLVEAEAGTDSDMVLASAKDVPKTRPAEVDRPPPAPPLRRTASYGSAVNPVPYLQNDISAVVGDDTCEGLDEDTAHSKDKKNKRNEKRHKRRAKKKTRGAEAASATANVTLSPAASASASEDAKAAKSNLERAKRLSAGQSSP